MSFAPTPADRPILPHVPTFNKGLGIALRPASLTWIHFPCQTAQLSSIHEFVMRGLRARYNQRAPSRPELIKTAATHSTRNAHSGTAMRDGASMRCVDPSR